MVLRAFWRHVEHNYREGGVRQVLFKIWMRLSEWAWSDSAWLVYQIDLVEYERAGPRRLQRSALDFESLLRHDYPKARAFPEVIRSRFKSGASCSGFFSEGKLATIAWMTRGHLEIEEGTSVREDNCLGIFDCLTFPEHRSKGHYTESLIQLAEEARTTEAAVVLIAVDPGNLPSVKGIERAGFKPLYRLARSRRIGRTVWHRSEFALRFEGS